MGGGLPLPQQPEEGPLGQDGGPAVFARQGLVPRGGHGQEIRFCRDLLLHPAPGPDHPVRIFGGGQAAGEHHPLFVEGVARYAGIPGLWGLLFLEPALEVLLRSLR